MGIPERRDRKKPQNLHLLIAYSDLLASVLSFLSRRYHVVRQDSYGLEISAKFYNFTNMIQTIYNGSKNISNSYLIFHIGSFSLTFYSLIKKANERGYLMITEGQFSAVFIMFLGEVIQISTHNMFKEKQENNLSIIRKHPPLQGVQRRMLLVVYFFRIFEFIFYCFAVAIFEAIPPLFGTPDSDLFRGYSVRRALVHESANGMRTPNFVFCKKKSLKLEVKKLHNGCIKRIDRKSVMLEVCACAYSTTFLQY